MSETEINKIIAHNINIQLSINNKTQADLAKYMKVSQATVSNWCKGIKMPRMDKIDAICSYFHIKRSDLMEEKSDLAEDKSKEQLNAKDRKDISAILANTEELLQQDGLMFDGEPASQESIDSILSAMKIGMELAKQKNKEKYTPKKYKKD